MLRRLMILSLVLIGFPFSSTQADSIVVRIDAQGRKVYTNIHDNKKPSLKVSLKPEKYRPYIDRIRELSRKYNVDIDLILALIAVESDFRHRAVSRAGAIGLMQLMPETADRYGVNPWDPEDNLEGGVRHLAYLLHKYPDLKTVLAAYNAGEQAVEKYGGIPPYTETQQYIQSILSLYKQRHSVAYMYTNPEGVIFFSYQKPAEGSFTLLKRIELDR